MRSSYFHYLTPLSLGAIVLGVLLGTLAHGGLIDLGSTAWLEDLASIWISLLKIIALPLMLAFIAHAIVSRPAAVSGKIGGLAFVAHAGLLAIFALVSIGMTVIALPLIDLGDEPLSGTEGALLGPAGESESWLHAVARFAADNPVSTLVEDHIVTALLITVALSLAATRFDAGTRVKLDRASTAIAGFTTRIIAAFILTMPLVVFAFAFLFADSLGLSVAGVVVVFLVMILTILAVLLGLLVLVGRFGGDIPFRTLLPALAPIVLLAFSTRSSLACMPLSLEVARDRLGLSESVFGVVIPLSAAAFKLNKVATSPARMLFLAYAYGIAITPSEIAMFALVAGLQSFGSPGLPSASAFKMLPLYVALGIPAEAYVLLHVVDSIPDLLKTALNATEDLTLAALVERIIRR